MKEEQKSTTSKKYDWKAVIIVTAITIVSLAAILITIMQIMQTTQINAEQQPTNQSGETINDIEEEIKLEDLTPVSNKTEEELKKINDKEVKKEEQNKNKNTNKESKKNLHKYYIKVNYTAQVVNVYTYDKDGKYTVPVKAFVCSTGTETPTSGVYRIPAKITWCFMYGDVYAHYCTQIVGNILFHSVPYLEKRNDTLEYWAYDKLGTKASMGCVRLTTRDAKWIFDNVEYGTSVEFYSSSNPGPLGKPTARKISDAPGNLRNWDPTDPDSRNPWHTYKPQEDKKEENVVNNEVSNNETQNNEISNNDIANETTNNEVVNNEIQNSEVDNNEQTNNVQNDETVNNQVQNSESDNNENQNNQQQNNETANNEQKTNDDESQNTEISSNQV